MRTALAATLSCFALAVQAQDIPFHEYDPPSTLVVPENPVSRAKYPFIDVHNHQFRMADQDLGELIVEMEKLNMAVMVNLSGRGFRRVQAADGTTQFGLQDGDYLARVIGNARGNAPGRFVVFTNVDFTGIDDPGWTERAVLPNVYTEIGAVLAEIGRQPRFARQFFIRYQDRILFGKDSWAPAEYHVYFRVLETADEYFDYYRRRHAFWKIYGIDLPDEVLKKVYFKNALALIPGIDRSLFPD